MASPDPSRISVGAPRARQSIPWRHWAPLAAGAAVVLLTRLPWLMPGYGSDPDAYRVARVARLIAGGGAYEASRLPGYPLYEYLCALSAWAPAWASNLVCALFSVAVYVLFVLLLRVWSVPRATLIALALVMTPVLYVNSCCSMDYIPALAFMLAASWAVVRERAWLAGLLLGSAVACRITAGALLLPLCAWLFATRGRAGLRPSLRLAMGTLLGALPWYVPVWRRYGSGFFTFYDNDGYPPLTVVFERALPLVWGQLGLVALALFVLSAPWWWRYLRSRWRQPAVRHALLLCATAFMLFVVAFVRLPDEAGYLIPAVPFAWLALVLLAPEWLTLTLSLLLLGSSLLVFDHAVPRWQGAIVEDHAIRVSQQRATRDILQAVARLPGNAVIVSGWVLPRIELELGGVREGGREFIYLVENDGDWRHYMAEGKQLYYLPGVDLYESQVHQLELAQLGARRLGVMPELQRPASTGE